MSQQCRGVKMNGIQCQRLTRTPYCHLHQKQMPQIEDSGGGSREPLTKIKNSEETPEKILEAPSTSVPSKESQLESECSICLIPGPYQLLPCGHNYFCSSCLATWTRQTCPFCWAPYGKIPKNPTSVPKKVPQRARRAQQKGSHDISVLKNNQSDL